MLEMFISFFKIGAFTIGGGYAMLPLIEQEFVVRKKWVSRSEIIDIFAVSQTFPGVIAINASLFVGYKVSKIPGACIAAAGVILPSFFTIIIIAALFAEISSFQAVQNAFSGIRSALTALILFTVIKMGRSVLKNGVDYLIAGSAFIMLAFFEVHPIMVIVLSGISGVIICQVNRK